MGVSEGSGFIHLIHPDRRELEEATGAAHLRSA